MKNSICGFNQENAVKMGLKGNDLLVLRWLVDFSASPKMNKTMHGGTVYYWVDYQAVLNDLPILDVSKQQLRKGIFQRLVDAGILIRQTVKKKGDDGGTYSTFAFGKNYDLLISDETDKREQSTSSPVGRKVPTPMVENYPTKTFRLNDPSIKRDNYTEERRNRSSDPPHFSKEIQEFVTKTYPAAFKQIKGYPHPKLSPIQQYRTEQIFNDFLKGTGEDIANIEGAAEYFIENTKTDGNIRTFAHPKTIEVMICRM